MSAGAWPGTASSPPWTDQVDRPARAVADLAAGGHCIIGVNVTTPDSFKAIGRAGIHLAAGARMPAMRNQRIYLLAPAGRQPCRQRNSAQASIVPATAVATTTAAA